MKTIAYGLMNKNPFAYLLIFIILYPPIIIIVFAIIDRIRNKNK